MTFDTATSTTLQVQREAFYCPYELLFKKYCYIIIHATICGKRFFEYVNVSLIHPSIIVSVMMKQRKTVSLANGWEDARYAFSLPFSLRIYIGDLPQI